MYKRYFEQMPCTNQSALFVLVSDWLQLIRRAASIQYKTKVSPIFELT